MFNFKSKNILDDEEDQDISSSTPGLDLYRENLLAMPERPKIGLGNKLVSALVGAFYGPEEGRKVQDNPYHKSIQDWSMRTNASKDLAGLEIKSAADKRKDSELGLKSRGLDLRNKDIDRKEKYGNDLLEQRREQAKAKLDVDLQNAKTSADRVRVYEEYVKNSHSLGKERNAIGRERNAISRDKGSKVKELSPGQQSKDFENQLNNHLANHPEDLPLLKRYRDGERLNPEEQSQVQFILSNARKPKGMRNATPDEIQDFEPEENDEDFLIEEEN